VVCGWWVSTDWGLADLMSTSGGGTERTTTCGEAGADGLGAVRLQSCVGMGRSFSDGNGLAKKDFEKLGCVDPCRCASVGMFFGLELRVFVLDPWRCV